MEEETKPEEPKPSYLEEVKAEREAMEKVRDELKELTAQSILSGKGEVSEPEVKKEETPKEYADRIMKGE